MLLRNKRRIENKTEFYYFKQKASSELLVFTFNSLIKLIFPDSFQQYEM